MSHNINIILAKASWCPHCVDFTPIFELAKQKIKPEDIDNCSIKLLSYELDKPNVKQQFQQKHPGLLDFLEGYPTVYFQMTENNGNSRPKTEYVNHTMTKDRGQQGIEKAAQEFVQNIINKYKSIKSGNKVEYVTVQKRGQKGGQLEDIRNHMTSMEEVGYRNKYLKYKSKYLELKNN